MTGVRHRALLLGNSVFDEDDGLPPLKGPANDVRLLGNALTDEKFGVHRREDVQIRLDLTSSEMRQALNDFFSSGTSGEQLLLYYSGHGLRNDRGGLYLSARDTIRTRKPATAISDATIREMIGESSCRTFVLILDCCFSGAFSFKAGDDIPEALKGEGCFLLTSSQRAETSEDAGKTEEGSVFTRFLVESLLSLEPDVNRDKWITIDEAYGWLYPRMRNVTKQTPQRHYHNGKGDVVIARAPRMSTVPPPPGPGPAPGRQASLELSTYKLEREVEAGESFVESIEVFDERGAELDWTVEASEAWITLRRRLGFFEIEVRPERVGKNLGTVIVKDPRAGTKHLRVAITVVPAAKKVLEVDPARLEFGTIRSGTSAMQTMRVYQGGSSLRATASDARVRAEVRGETVEVAIDTASPATIAATVTVESDTGKVAVPLTAVVEPGPILRLDPTRVDFGNVKKWTSKKRVTVENAGKGMLEWSHAKDGEFFDATAGEGFLDVTLVQVEPGNYHGSIRIASNGGNGTVNVHAHVVDDRPREPPPQPPQPQPTQPQVAPGLPLWAGHWRITMTVFGVASSVLTATLHPGGPLQGTQELMGFQVAVQGQWGYNPATRQFYMQLVTMAGADTRVVQITREVQGGFEGQDQMGVVYLFQRMG